MASDAYISTYDKTGSKTVHVNSAGAITAPMQYAIWDKVTKSALVVCDTAANAESELRTLFLKNNNDGRYAVVTVPK